MSVFAERLRNLRDATGQTQGEVGKAVGKSRESVSKYEIGDREPDTEAIAAIAMHFKVSADYILGITDDIVTLNSKGNKNYYVDIFRNEKYLKDENFVPYFNLATKMHDNTVEIKAADRMINRLIYLRKNKRK